ncbi:alpha-amylase family glycosyl hydrolase [Mycoplasma procyoni]|uniref:alpha-amylase family glycosyl hydrolase n=1 Tax=Mycoplasma procyoni TaxID=568784 RepID=UPI00197BCB69|nr:alpha-amylase family glycosyl hydrolase [Mycoplasma procyoni]MBN3534633.1 hypothetical protein [Mycoplasma procyoni]
MNNKIKKIYYEAYPRYFFDYNSSGFGDYDGIVYKKDYFQFLGVDSIIVPSLLENYEKIEKKELIDYKYGSIASFKNMIKVFKKDNIKVSVVFDFNIFDKYLEWFQNYTKIINDDIEFEQSMQDTQSFFIEKNITDVIDLPWLKTQKIEEFMKIVEFYIDLGVESFCFKNFLELNKTKENKTNVYNIDENSATVTNDLVNKIKSLKKDTEIYGVFGFDFYDKKHFKYIKNFRFDDFILDFISPYWLTKKQNETFLKKYNHFLLLPLINKITKTNSGFSFILNNNYLGKLASRLAENSEQNNELQKVLLTILMLNNHNSYITQGDEIAQENIKFHKPEELNDPLFNVIKRDFEYKGLTVEDFFKNKSALSYLNNNAPLMWDEKGNFNKTKTPSKLVAKKPNNYQKNNITSHYEDPNSVFNWLLYILKFKKMSLEQDDSKKLKLKPLYSLFGLIKIDINLSSSKYVLLINATPKYRKIPLNKKKYSLQRDSLDAKNENFDLDSLKPFQILILKKENKKAEN